MDDDQRFFKVISFCSALEMESKELLLVEHKIRVARGEIKVLEKQIPKNRDAIDVKETEMTGLVLKYEELAGQPYIFSLADMAIEFCEDYYADYDNDIDDRARLLERYYHEDCSALIIGWGRIKGRDEIIENILVSSFTVVLAIFETME